jgi:indolepyruvate ferredoxin oxidoreductase beta subunit
MRQQILICGVGGQGIVLLGRVIAEAAILKGLPVIVSETHGMAQRGGIVVSHIKVGGFISPLIKVGSADIIFALKKETLPQFIHYLRPEGVALCNSPAESVLNDIRSICLDAEKTAREANNPKSVNIAMLGFAFARPSVDKGLRLFCSDRDIEEALVKRFVSKEEALNRTLTVFNRAKIQDGDRETKDA